jgi:sialic acid synthase SpsE
MVEGIRTVETTLGDGVKRPAPSEADNRLIVRRSLAATSDIPAGTVLEADMLVAVRPASGISPSLLEHVLGRRAKRTLVAGKLISWEDLA